MAEYALNMTSIVTSGEPLVTVGTWRDATGYGTPTVGDLTDGSDSTYVYKTLGGSTARLVAAFGANALADAAITAGVEIPVALRMRARFAPSSVQATYRMSVGNNVGSGVESATNSVSVVGSPSWHETGTIVSFGDGSTVYSNYMLGAVSRKFVGIFADPTTNPSHAGLFHEMQLVLLTESVPVVTVGPVPAATSSPTITWEWFDADGDPQGYYSVKVFTAAQAANPSFDPDATIPVFNSGQVASALTYAVAQSLTAGTDYVAYVRAAKSGSGAPDGLVWSEWAVSDEWQVTVSPPAAPTVAVAWQSGSQAMKVDLKAYRNLLSVYKSSFELPGGIWTGTVTNCAVTRTDEQALVGSYSMRLESAGAGTMSVRCDERIPVIVGETYSAVAQFRSEAVNRTGAIHVRWYDADGAVISTVGGLSANTTTTDWNQATTSSTAPPGAVAAELSVSVNTPVGAGEVHYVDQVGFNCEQAGYTWTPGGGLYFTAQVQRSVDGSGGPWVTITDGGAVDLLAAPHEATIYDYEVERGKTARYRAQLTLTDQVGVTQISDWSSAFIYASTTSDTTWWFKALADPAMNAGAVNVQGELEETTEADVGVFRPLDSEMGVVVSGQVGGEDGKYRVFTATETAWTGAIKPLVRHTGLILVQDPVGRQKYVKWTSRSVMQRYSGGNVRREISLGFVEVAGPPEPVVSAPVVTADLTMIYDDDLYGFFDVNTFG